MIQIVKTLCQLQEIFNDNKCDEIAAVPKARMYNERIRNHNNADRKIKSLFGTVECIHTLR
jgi:hypothetical protein